MDVVVAEHDEEALENKFPGVTGGPVGPISAAGGKVLVVSGGNQSTINM